MEVGLDILKEAGQEDSRNGHTSAASQGVGGGRNVGREAESDFDQLIEEGDTGILGPANQSAYSKGKQGDRRGGVFRD